MLSELSKLRSLLFIICLLTYMLFITFANSDFRSPLSSQDQFSFCIFLPYLLFDLQVFFCIRYEAAGAVHWDSNGGANYKLYCKPIAPSNRNPFFDTDCSIFF